VYQQLNMDGLRVRAAEYSGQSNRQFSRSCGRWALLTAAALLLGACSGALRWEGGDDGQGASAGAQYSPALAQQVAANAQRMIGTPYKYGGSSPGGFDCSGLVQYSYSQVGVSVPRTSREQFKATNPVELKDARPGDLLFFRYNRSISHVGIYLGDLRFVHAPSSGKQVSVASLETPHYREHFVRAGRL